MKSKFFACSVALVSSVLIGSAFAAEFELVSVAPLEVSSQKFSDSAYTTFKLRGAGSFENSKSKIFKTGMAFSTECVGYSKAENGKSSIDSHCTSNSEDGAVLHATFFRSGVVGESNIEGQARLTIVAGTNLGAKAECVYTPHYVKGSEGTYLVTRAKCTTAE